MKYGIFYGYWKNDWSGDYIPLVSRAAACGFDILAISSGFLVNKSENELRLLRDEAQRYNIALHAGYGPGPDKNVASTDPTVVKTAIEYYGQIFKTLKKLDIHCLGGNFYSCAPQDLQKPIDKRGDWDRCVKALKKLSVMAADNDVTLAMEIVCRYEGYLINTATEGVEFVNQVNCDNVRLMLDTFHMNIEEDSFSSAIHTAGKYLAYMHTGECNRRVPGYGRIPWNEVAYALNDIGFDGPITMEPFISNKGSIGADLGVWRDLSYGASEEELDSMAKQGLQFTKSLMAGARQTSTHNPE